MVLSKCFLPIVLLIGTSYGLPYSSNLDDIIFDVFSKNWDYEHNQPLPVTEPKPVTEPQPLNYKPYGIQRICVPRFLCDNNDIVTTGAGVFESRRDSLGAFDPRIDSTECDSLHVCCNTRKKYSVITTTPIITPQRISPPVISVQNVGCGHRNPEAVRLIRINNSSSKDNVTEFAEFPWMVAILHEIPATDVITLNLYVCGGSLIAPTVILTAAHCARQFVANNLIARAGEWNTQSKTEVLPYQDRRVHEIILNENFDKGSYYNNIALLTVDIPFIYEDNVRPICLPPPNANFDFSRCYATGWGKDKYGEEGFYQEILKKVDLPVVPRNQCQTNLRKTRLGVHYNLHESFICAGGELGKDTCTGDGGSPLVCPIEGKDNQFYQAGIVAYGVGCGEENVPGVYANVAHLRPWINEKLFEMRVNLSHYTP